jgi:hypothetical protein
MCMNYRPLNETCMARTDYIVLVAFVFLSISIWLKQTINTTKAARPGLLTAENQVKPQVELDRVLSRFFGFLLNHHSITAPVIYQRSMRFRVSLPKKCMYHTPGTKFWAASLTRHLTGLGMTAIYFILKGHSNGSSHYQQLCSERINLSYNFERNLQVQITL